MSSSLQLWHVFLHSVCREIVARSRHCPCTPIVSFLLRLTAVGRAFSDNECAHRSRLPLFSGSKCEFTSTFLLFLVWIWFSYYQVEGFSGAVQGVLFVLALFACVLLHEFGHAFAS